jgi:hypothetical protein
MNSSDTTRYAFIPSISSPHYTTCLSCRASRLHRTKLAATRWMNAHECPRGRRPAIDDRSRPAFQADRGNRRVYQVES